MHRGHSSSVRLGAGDGSPWPISRSRTSRRPGTRRAVRGGRPRRAPAARSCGLRWLWQAVQAVHGGPGKIRRGHHAHPGVGDHLGRAGLHGGERLAPLRDALARGDGQETQLAGLHQAQGRGRMVEHHITRVASSLRSGRLRRGRSVWCSPGVGTAWGRGGCRYRCCPVCSPRQVSGERPKRVVNQRVKVLWLPYPSMAAIWPML